MIVQNVEILSAKRFGLRVDNSAWQQIATKFPGFARYVGSYVSCNEIGKMMIINISDSTADRITGNIVDENVSASAHSVFDKSEISFEELS
ncbi:unnamed protein product [Clavelina lepadiformis]|uniref:Uncharacterized protein n=1 Tax=Clavelina lepadiformis TaxID=159417 RepID=A0ABP0GQ65_CLALP